MRALLLAPTWLWLVLFVAAPAGLLLVIALASVREGVPPFAFALDTTSLSALADPFYLHGLAGSLAIGAATALGTMIVGYPMALAIARATPRRRGVLLLLLIMLPFWSGMLLRLTAWIGILRDEGWLNDALLAAALIDAPLPMLHGDGAMMLGLVSSYLPFFVLPVQARLSAADPTLVEAAADLGATPWRVFRRVTWPLGLPGVWAGLALVFVPASGEYVIPELLGSPATPTLARAIWDEFFRNGDWPQASALAVALLVLLLVPALALRRA